MDKAYIVRNIAEFRYINANSLKKYYQISTMESILKNHPDGILVYGWCHPEFDDLKILSYHHQPEYIKGHVIIKVSDLMINIIRRKKIKKINKCE